ncbi:MAG: TIGR03862 family flavoprotein [Beijerinckiaceae bacterium]|nr:TIGR03862 family flavoprotein [Beijerinckiaceae bacterium]
MNTHTKTVAIIGGGAAGLMAAEAVALSGARAIIYDRMPSLARKFLLAGRGGLNLTHSEPLDAFVTRYGAASGRLAPILEAFPPADLIAWCEALGEPTFVGTSGRVFPTSFKASPLLRRWLRRLESQGVEVRQRHAFAGFDAHGKPVIEGPDGARASVEADATILALGGASWPRLGSDGSWAEALREKGVHVAPLRPSNCGFEVAWSPFLREKFAGAPLKNVALTFGRVRLRGEAMISQSGLEGGGIYALSGAMRDSIEANGFATLYIDLRPDLSPAALLARLHEAKASQSISNVLRKLGLSPAAAGLLREPGPLPKDAEGLAKLIKGVPVHLTGVRPIARAISSAGGVAWDEVDANLMLTHLPGVFVAGEMLDWEAPTGGYLLQACFSTGRMAGQMASRYAKAIS